MAVSASCALTTDYTFGCDKSVGGVKTFWLIELDNVSSIGESSGMITAITKAGGKVFRKYQLVLETSSTVEAITGNRQNGTLYYAQTATMIINRQQVAVRNEILLIAKNNLILISEDNAGDWRMYGRENGLVLTGGEAASGVAWADRNGYTLTLTGNEFELAPFVSEAVIATLQT